tara:strand:+ start:212 stop:331 length:120 start_codon:yes stop_codon:yes gene_type:complete
MNYINQERYLAEILLKMNEEDRKKKGQKLFFCVDFHHAR